ncbi:MAG: anti-sigma factor [Burkholderiaceae bacterium]|nr:anti-sigma factor [Roseateles sp.]MBV8469013.1 anti-sigma factor [Burkholderiaceae bacterium]
MKLQDDELSALIRTQATRHAAPDQLRAALRTRVALADASRTPQPDGLKAEAPRLARWLAFQWRPAAISFALGLACALVLGPWLQRLDGGTPLDQALVANHVHALQQGTLMAVVSTDRHTVKPWFQGRLDFAPPVFDLANDGFPLLGGRTERVKGQVVAGLVYARNKHMIDLFVWPSADRSTPMPVVYRGFNVLHWSDGAMQYWAVSDLERAQMERFAQAWQQRATVP